MKGSKIIQSDLQNSLLRALPEEEFQAIAPHLERVTLKAGAILHETGESAQGVYFMDEGIASEMLQTRSGKSIELTVIGNEGLIGERAVFGKWGLTDIRCLMFSDAVALKMDPKTFHRLFKQEEMFQDLILNRIEARLIETSQVALCNQHHTVEQRLCRWLLTLAYRSHSDRFQVTHEHISDMLGVRRSTVTDILGGLKEAGTVEYSRSSMAILDPGALEMESCECYEVVKKATHAPLSEYHEQLGKVIDRVKDASVESCAS